MLSIIKLPAFLQRRLEHAAGAFFNPKRRELDFALPPGEPALVPVDSVSWRVFKNPVALFVGGVAAVILELAEPAVRSGVWEHSSFRRDPIGRLQRTGLAAMVTIYGARSVAEPMIASIVRMHAAVQGESAGGAHYSANDPRLLTWVHATAVFSFAQAYSRYVEPLSHLEIDAMYREGIPASRLYGARGAPASAAAMQSLFKSMSGKLEASPVVFAFLDVMRKTPALPRPILWLQPMLVRAAVELIPQDIRSSLGLGKHLGLRPHERWLVRFTTSRNATSP